MRPAWLKVFLCKYALPALFWLALWQGLAVKIGKELLLPSPFLVLARFTELAGTASFWRCAAYSLARIFAGIIFGIFIGILAACLTESLRLADALLSPMIRIIRSVPVASFIILVLLWVRTTMVPVVISTLMVLPVMWADICAGIRSADPGLLEFARAYRLGRPKTWRYIYLPAVRPHFNAAICTSIGLAWKSGIAAEVLCLPKVAVGRELYYSKIYLETPSLFAWTILVIVLSWLIETAARKGLLAGGGQAKR